MDELDDKLVSRLQGSLPAVKLGLPADTPGSPEWTANAVFGGRLEFKKMLQQLVVGAGAQGEQRWRDLVSLDLRLAERGEDVDLNQLCATAGVDGRELLAFVGRGVQSMYAGLARLKASLAAPGVIDVAELAAQDPEKGRGDREMLLRIAGVIEPSGGVVINNTAVAQARAEAGGDSLRAPLMQFRETLGEIDRAARDAVDGEVVEGEVVE